MNFFCKITNVLPEKTIADSFDSGNTEKEAPGISDGDLSRLYSVEFKSQSYASFYNTTLEKDKSILTLSVAGIGFLLALLNLSKSVTYYDLAIYVVAAFAFLVSIYCILKIFSMNANFIIDLTQDKDVTLKQYKLDQLDKFAINSFYVAIVMSVILGITSATSLITNGENKMTKEKTVEEMIALGWKPANESYNGAQDLTKSFQGAEALKPNIVVSAQAQSSSNSSGASALKPVVTPQNGSGK